MSRSSGKQKKAGSGLGRAILKERNRARRSRADGSWLHTSELDDGRDWSKLNLHSVTEESQLDEFLRTAELAGIEFTAERLNIKVVDPASSHIGLPSAEEEREIEKTHEKYRQFIGIPRRPKWGPSTTPEQLDLLERESYLTWRRHLAKLEEEEEKLVFTPFEKNLHFWRQLWRVIERSDVIVQIVDARNPLLFRCEDLEKYVKELNDKKVNLILMSKADLLSWQQRLSWSQYFTEKGISAAFWSATLAENPPQTTITTTTEMSREVVGLGGAEVKGEPCLLVREVETESEGASIVSVSPEILSREGLLQLFQSLSPVTEGGLTTVGLVGYPNVGKSSTINVLYQEKKVPVSATPGRTKHFQTLHILEQLLLCDCPGLVFPSLISTKAEMVVSGILPIDQMRDHTPPVALVCQRIPRSVLERVYGIRLPSPAEGEDPARCPTPQELLSAYGYLHGYMTSHGLPDCSRSARYILKDYVNGKLLYCHPPPGIASDTFNPILANSSPPVGEISQQRVNSPLLTSNEELGKGGVTLSEFDKQFLKQDHVRAIVKGCQSPFTAIYGQHLLGDGGREEEGECELRDDVSVTSSVVSGGKQWKRHNNRHKKEKTRRTIRTT